MHVFDVFGSCSGRVEIGELEGGFEIEFAQGIAFVLWHMAGAGRWGQWREAIGPCGARAGDMARHAGNMRGRIIEHVPERGETAHQRLAGDEVIGARRIFPGLGRRQGLVERQDARAQEAGRAARRRLFCSGARGGLVKTESGNGKMTARPRNGPCPAN